jgi:hypothetical protein
MINVSEVFAALTPREIKEAFNATKDKVNAAWSQHTAKRPEGLRHE